MSTTDCPSCGFEQEVGAECVRCGIIYQRYHATRAREPSEDVPTEVPTPRASPLRSFYRTFRWVTLAALAAVVILVLRQSSPPVVDVDPRAELRLQSKVREVERSIRSSRPQPLRLQEAELNSWMSRNLALAKPSPETAAPIAPPASPDVEEVQSAMRDIKMKLSGNLVSAYVLFDFHGKELSLFLEGYLQTQDGQLRFRPTAGKLGSLPLPQMVLDRAVERLFESPENRDKFRLPPDIANIHAANSELGVSYRSRR